MLTFLKKLLRLRVRFYFDIPPSEWRDKNGEPYYETDMDSWTTPSMDIENALRSMQTSKLNELEERRGRLTRKGLPTDKIRKKWSDLFDIEIGIDEVFDKKLAWKWGLFKDKNYCQDLVNSGICAKRWGLEKYKKGGSL